MLEEHGTYQEPNRNLPHSFQNSPKTSAAVRLNVLKWQSSIYCLHIWEHLSEPTWRRVVETYSGILEFCPYYSWYFHSCPVFLCSVHLSERKYPTGTPVELSTHHLQVIVRTRTPEAFKKNACTSSRNSNTRVNTFPRDNHTLRILGQDASKSATISLK
jgi:hypothetical protein